MRYPKFLGENGTIGFIAPSFGAFIEPYHTRFESAIAKLSAMGYRTVEGPNTRCGDGIGISSTPENCGREINDFFINDKSDIIISCGGGELMCEDLEYVDFEAIKKANPKWFIGYSDNTNLTFMLATKCDIASIYGPCASDFGMNPWHESIEDAFNLLKGEKLSMHNYDKWEKANSSKEFEFTAPYDVTEKYCQTVWTPTGDKNVSLAGRLIGGCLDVLANLSGTRFDCVDEFNERYKEDGIIWYLESCDLNVFSMRRALWQLKNTGWFKYVKAFLIGRPLKIDDFCGDFGPHDAYLGILKEFNVPVVMDLDIGHLSPMIPIICGGFAKCEVGEKEFSIEYILK